jgi:hypothetical protein
LRKARFVNATTKIIRGIIFSGKYRQTEQQQVARSVRVAKSKVCQWYNNKSPEEQLANK